MINVKGGTQTFSSSIQESNFRSDKTQTLSTAEQKKFYGDREIGEVLNQVADPNWIDPKKARKVGEDSMGKDGFLKLFLAQLKNQDPTNPMQGHELAGQLAQFTSLEKLNNIDTGIQTMAKAKSGGQGDFQVLNLIGKSVAGDSSKIIRSDSEESHDIRFTLPVDAVRIKMSIVNENNKVVRTLEHHNIKSGANTINWNGLNEDGLQSRLGSYNVKLEAFGSAGQKVAAFTKFEGKISGVNFTPNGTVLMIGNQTIRMQDVKKIFDGSAKNEMNAGRPPLADQMNRAKEAMVQQVIKAEKGKANNSAGQTPGLGEVGFSRELANKVKKETGSNQGIL